MIRFVLDAETIGRVSIYEEDYLAKCSQIIETYMADYADFGCEISYGLFWQNQKNNIYKERPLLGNGYECWFGYAITKNGQFVCCDDIEGYTLGMSECFLYIRKRRKQIGKSFSELIYVDIVDDLAESLEQNLSIRKEMYI